MSSNRGEVNLGVEEGKLKNYFKEVIMRAGDVMETHGMWRWRIDVKA